MMLEKKKRILIAHYYQPYPPRDGAARRCIDMVKAFQLLGYDVTLFTSDLVHPFSLSAEAIKKAKDELNIQLVVYKSAADERQYIQSKSFKWNAYVTPGLIHYFSLLHKSLQPEIVLVNYVFWAELAIEKQFKNCMRIIDAIDVLSLNQKMAAITVSYLNKGEVSNNSQYSIEGANGEVLEEDFFLRFDLAADQEEYDKYDQFDLTVAISANETALIKENTKSTKCVYLPFFFDVGKDKKIYTGPPIFAIGANQFNYQGYLYFVKKVLPKVLKERPDFVLHVVGDGCKHLEPTKGIALLGFVSDLNELYLKSGFAICPLIGATGQQLKVMEAMAKGLPVIALRNVAERCPIIHNYNGLIADNAEDFARYVLMLYSDPGLCYTLGGQALKTIEQQFSVRQLIDKLKLTLSEIAYKKVSVFNSITKPYWYLVLKYNILQRKYAIRYEHESPLRKVKYKLKVFIKGIVQG